MNAACVERVMFQTTSHITLNDMRVAAEIGFKFNAQREMNKHSFERFQNCGPRVKFSPRNPARDDLNS